MSGRAKLDAEVLAWMHEPGWREDDARFEELSLRVFAFQFEHCEAFGRFCRGRGRTPATVRSWRDVPPVPTGAFKEMALRSFLSGEEVHVFRTSGTSTAGRGELHLDTLELYEASLLPSFRRHVLPDLGPGERAELLVLTPSPEEAPDSSLSHLFGVLLRELGSAGSDFGVRDGALQVEAVRGHLSRARRPLTLCGTAFAFVHLVDALAQCGERVALPPGSRVMETGGFKGRSRELPREELYAAIELRLGVPADRIVNQYGMTELGSQFHDSVLLRPREARRKLAPPWTRVAILDPESGALAEPGSVGPIAIFDLANTGSVFAVLTADLGRQTGDGFEVIGRDSGAEERGCSIAADELMTGSTT